MKIEKSWRWGREINMANRFGKIKWIKIYKIYTYEGKNIFSEFITDLYNRRKES